MAFNLRGGTPIIPDGSITAAKLADGSVIESKIAANAVTNPKIATDAVSEAKIQDAAITTGKIDFDAVTPDRMTYSAATDHILGVEQEFSNVGTTLTTVAEMNFTNDGSTANFYKRLSFSALLDLDNPGQTASLELWVDGISLATVTTSLANSELASEATITDPTLRTHLIELKLKNTEVTGTTTLKRFELFGTRKS